MPTGTVTTTHVDGGLGLSTAIADRVHAKILVAETGDANRAYLILNKAHAKNIFGRGPLVDALVQHFEEFNEDLGQVPQPVLCVRPDNDQAGSSAVNADAANTGLAATPTLTGTPTGSAVVVLLITKSGAHATAEYRRSTDGGVTFEAPLVTPATGTPIALSAGVTATFADDGTTPADTFKAGDRFVFTIKGPTASYASHLDALMTLKQEYRPRWIQIGIGATRAFATSVNQALIEFETSYNLPTFAVLQAKSFAEQMPPATPETPENISDYFQAIDEEFDPFFSPRVAIVSARARYIAGGIAAYGGIEAVKDAGSTIGEFRNAATLLCAKLAAGPVNESAGFVQNHRSLTMSEIEYWQQGYQDWMDVLHDKGHVVLKEYNNFEGIFIARDRLKAHPESDFQQIPEKRRADKAHRIVYQISVPKINADTQALSFDFMEADASAAVKKAMVQPGRAEISGFEITFDPEKTFSKTGIIEALLTMYIRGRAQAISWKTSFAQAE